MGSPFRGLLSVGFDAESALRFRETSRPGWFRVVVRAGRPTTEVGGGQPGRRLGRLRLLQFGFDLPQFGPVLEKCPDECRVRGHLVSGALADQLRMVLVHAMFRGQRHPRLS